MFKRISKAISHSFGQVRKSRQWILSKSFFQTFQTYLGETKHQLLLMATCQFSENNFFQTNDTFFKFQDYIWFAKNDFSAEEFNKRLRGFIYLQVSLASNFRLFVSSKATSSSLTDLLLAGTKLDIGWSWSFLFQISVESSSFWTRNLRSEVWTFATRAVQGDQEAAQEVGA